MHKLQHKGLDKIITFLDAINCQYKIIDELGNVHSNFTEIEKKSKRKPSFYPHGEMMKYVKQQLEPMKVGEDEQSIHHKRTSQRSLQKDLLGGELLLP
jgi:hypothetical protein